MGAPTVEGWNHQHRSATELSQAGKCHCKSSTEVKKKMKRKKKVACIGQ